MEKKIRDFIMDSISSDDSFTQRDDKNIEKIYRHATLTEKNKIDEIFIRLCGYSLATAINCGEKSIDDSSL